LLAGLMLLSVAGCSNKGRVIPEKDFSNLLVDMFIADQWLREHGMAREKADTTLYFEPIFNKYGYSFKDYDASLHYYAEHVEELSDAVTDAVVTMRKMKDRYAQLAKINKEVTLQNEKNMVFFEPLDFSIDSAGVSLPGSLWPDWPQADSLPVVVVKRELPGLLQTDSLTLDLAPREVDLKIDNKKLLVK